MTSQAQGGWIAPAIRATAAGLGAACFGPVGGIVGHLLGSAVLGEAAAKSIEEFARKFGETAGEKILESGADVFFEGKDKPPHGLEALYRQALRESLQHLPTTIQAGYEDWFSQWDAALAGVGTLDLPAMTKRDVQASHLNATFCHTLELLDAQGAALKGNIPSIAPDNLPCRSLPSNFLDDLLKHLPQALEDRLNDLIVLPEFDSAWKQVQQAFQQRTSDTLDLVASNTHQILSYIQQLNQDQETVRHLEETIAGLRKQLAQKSNGHEETELARLIDVGDFARARDLKARQLDAHRMAAAKLPQDYYEMAALYEMTLEWDKALEAARTAWLLKADPDYGLQYAYLAQKRGHFNEALAVLEPLRDRIPDPEKRGRALHDLGLLYIDTQRVREAQDTLQQAIEVQQGLVRDSYRHLPDLASTVIVLGRLYTEALRFDLAEVVLRDVLNDYDNLGEHLFEIDKVVFANALNEIGRLYLATDRLDEAESSFTRAIGLYRELPATQSLRQLLATSISNRGLVRYTSSRLGESDQDFREAITLQRQLAAQIPDAANSELARMLSAHAGLLLDIGELGQAEDGLLESLNLLAELVDGSRVAHLSGLGEIQHNLANLYTKTQRTELAAAYYGNAVETFRELKLHNPMPASEHLARTLRGAAQLYRDLDQVDIAMACCNDAAETLRPLCNANPARHGDMLATTLMWGVLLREERGYDPKPLCSVAEEALDAARDLQLQANIQGDIIRLNGGGPGFWFIKRDDQNGGKVTRRWHPLNSHDV